MRRTHRFPILAGSLTLLAMAFTAGVSGAQTCGGCDGGSTAQTVTHSGSIPAGPGFAMNPAFNQPIILPRYDPASHGNAPLVGVSVLLRGRVQSSGWVYNHNAVESCSGQWRSDIAVSMGSNRRLGLVDLGGGRAIALEVRRTETFINLSPQATMQFPEEERVATDGVCVLDPAALGSWTGAGDVTLLVSGFTIGGAPCIAPQCLGYSCGVMNAMRIEVEVTYTYCAGVGGDQGCSPGFWKNHLAQWVTTGFTPTDSWVATFGVPAFAPTLTLHDALRQGGGHWKRVGRHSTAALLNASAPQVDYPFTVSEVIQLVQQAWAAGDPSSVADVLEWANELGCPPPR